MSNSMVAPFTVVKISLPEVNACQEEEELAMLPALKFLL